MKILTFHHAIVPALAVATLVPSSSAKAQFRELPPPPAYALQNVTVVHADGRQEAGVNVVVRRGLIEAIGAEVEIPGDAKILEGDSLYVYPGIVDAHGEAELAFPEIERGDSVRSWDAPRELEGLLAHRRVADYLTQTGADGKDQRANGIVAAGVHPRGALAAGLGAAILYRTDVERPWELVANDNLGLSMAFQSGQGVYPGTLFGVIAYLRQAFEDAKRDGLILQAYGESPEGMGVPGFDPDYAVLREAMAGRILVYFAANGAEDIRRVLGLADEYSFRPVIVGGHEAWRVADELARRNVPVLIDGDFPEPDDWEEPGEEPEAEASEPAAASPDSLEQQAPPAGEPQEEEAQEELEPAAARDKKRIEDIRSNAGRLADAGVSFAITSGGGDGDIRQAARHSIKYGLSEAAALQAITEVPAAMLGIPNVARIGAGMSATFVAMSGPIFDEDSEVHHTFVEGGYEKGAGSGGGGDAPAVVVTGDWVITFASAGQEFPFDAHLEMDPDGSLSGSATNAQVPGTASVSGRVSGNRINFTVSIDAGGQQIEMSAEGTVEADRMSGSGDGPFGSFTFTGRKNPGGTR
jgi:hypothetical protein